MPNERFTVSKSWPMVLHLHCCFVNDLELYVLVCLYHALQSIICSKDGNDFPLFIGFNLNYLLAIFIYYFNIHVYGHSTPKFKSSCSG